MSNTPEMLQHPPHVLAGWGIQLAACTSGFQERKIKKTMKMSKQWYFYPSYTSTVNAKGVCRSGQKEGGVKKD